jgi:glucose-1-phosphate thymidylyltransferase
MKIACLEEIAFNNGWMSQEQMLERAQMFSKTDYGAYLVKKATYNDFF